MWVSEFVIEKELISEGNGRAAGKWKFLWAGTIIQYSE